MAAAVNLADIPTQDLVDEYLRRLSPEERRAYLAREARPTRPARPTRSAPARTRQGAARS